LELKKLRKQDGHRDTRKHLHDQTKFQK